MGQMTIRPGETYTFQYLKSMPVSWVVDAINESIDLIYLHQVGNGKTLTMGFEHFQQLYNRHGVAAE